MLKELNFYLLFTWRGLLIAPDTRLKNYYWAYVDSNEMSDTSS